ncbi:hypothetical protein [uncultured Mucilaginibacter sp.]|uniref:hypothetical protein n=2 Tax=Mucilaginibacter TaxID=423349 RepID=UPI0026254ACC|nr:hypothetical protein [uncultured Mucilaginibacter sp.]
MAKFVDIPVSLHTGIPQISIPLYTVKEGSLSLPISMSYHASGLKVNEPASWVGAGWALNAGGAITRSVRGTPDEKGTVNGFQKFGFYSDYGYRTHLLDVNTSGGRPDSNYFANYDRFFLGERDSEPDLFFFNFGGYSGKFYFNDDRTPMLLPEQDIKIEVNYAYPTGGVVAQSIQSFSMTTPDGVKYYFGATPSATDVDPIERTKVMTDQNGLGWDRTISSWYLNKIVSADGLNVITLNYHTNDYSCWMISTPPISAGQNVEGYNLVHNFIHGVELESIATSNAVVNFVGASSARLDLSWSVADGTERVNTTAKALDHIDILKKSGMVKLKSYRFTYDYFVDAVTPAVTKFAVVTTDKMRLKLLSIQESDSSGTANPPYKFDYFTEPVPRRMSFSQDHWGFINGAANGNSFIGTYYNTYNTTTPTTVTGADRDPHWPAMRGGTLNKITFPTGGFNMYDFEPNSTAISKTTDSNGERTFVISKTAGYDGCQCLKRELLPNQPLDFHQYVFSLTNGKEGGAAAVNVYDSNWTLLDHMDAQKDQTTEIQRNYPAGNYNFEVIKYDAYSGNGAYLNIYQLAGSVQTMNAMVGGLRIKKITQNSGNGNPDMVTEYDYNEGNNQLSSGVVFGKPTIAQVPRNDIYKNYNRSLNGYTGMYTNGCPFTPGSGMSLMVSAGSIRALNSSQGSHIGYHKVTTRQAGNGSTVSFFNMDGESNVGRDDIVNRTVVTSPNTCTMSIPNYPAAPDPNYFNRGELTYKVVYNEAGQLLTDETHSSDYMDNPIITPAFTIAKNVSTTNGNMMFTWYNQKTGRKVRETVIKKTYNPGGNFETRQTSFYDSPLHHQLTRTLTYSATGDSIETKYRYVADYTLNGVDNLDNGLTGYSAALSPIEYQFSAAYANCYTDISCQRNSWLDYDIALSHARKDFINYRIANFTGPNGTCKINLQNALVNATASLKPMIDMRQKNDLELVETVNLKNGKVINASFNSYDYKPASQNQIYLSKVSKTDYLVPPSTFTYTQTGTDNVSLVKDAAYNEKAAFEYSNGNITQVKLTDGAATAYRWGYNNQYPVLSVKNSLTSDIFFEGFEEGAGNGTLNDSKTGHYSYTGTYTKVLSGLTNGAYLLNYYQKTGGLWKWMTQSVTVSNGNYTISLNAQIDDIRFAPFGAMPSTFTYDPEIGMSSMMDVNGLVTYYDYDGFQRLNTIRDDNKNLLKKYYYNYSNGTADQDQNLPYALIEQTSFTSGNGGQNYATYAIRLYTDNTYTTLFNATQNITVNYRVSTSTSVNGGAPTGSGASYSVVINSGSSSVNLGSFEAGCGTAPALAKQSTAETSAKQESTSNVATGGGGSSTTCVNNILYVLTGTGYKGGVTP